MNPAQQINICHIGSRNGWSHNPLDCLGNDVYFTLFDADEEAVKKDQEKFCSKKVGRRNYLFIATCISSKKEKREFNINRDGNTSSLLSFNPEFQDFIHTISGFNYSLKDACTPVKQEEVNCLPLDQIFPKDAERKIDFLSMDTQGSEYEILLGSKNCLQETILGVTTEIEFIPCYKNQKLFGEIFSQLLKNGFIYVGMEGPYPMHYAQSLDYARGKGFAFAGDAFFIKDYKKILYLNVSRKRKVLMLFKLAAISLCFDLLDYAYQILKVLDQEYKNVLIEGDYNQKYMKLCKDYYRTYDKLMKKDFPKQKYFASNDEYWNGNSENNFKKSYDMKKNNKKSFSLQIIRKLFGKSQKKFLMRIIKRNAKLLAKIHCLITPKNSIETILHNYNLIEQAKTQKRTRSEKKFNGKKIARNILVR